MVKFDAAWWSSHEFNLTQLQGVMNSCRRSPIVAVPEPIERAGGDVEQAVHDVLHDLASDRIGKGTVEQIRDAANASIKRVDGSRGLGDAIRNNRR